jgi:hypothetical protein
MNNLKIPHNPGEAGVCYKRLKEALPVYQKGIADIQLEMNSKSPFDLRLRKVLRLHARTLQEALDQETSSSWNEEEVYLCCLYDMLEAFYIFEADRIAHSAGSSDEIRRSLNELFASIPKLPFGSSHYQSIIRPRLERAIIARAKIKS